MPTSAYVGLPGHGKSYSVVANVIAKALKSKRIIYTNIPMKTKECLKRFDFQVVPFDVQEIKDNPNWFTEVFEKGAIFVLDEVWDLWPSGMKANQVSDAHKTFLAKHRHDVGTSGHSTEIVLVTQDLGQIASFARALVDTTYRMVKHDNMGKPNRFRVDVYRGPITGPNPPVSKREREIQDKFKKENYELYHTATNSDVGAGDETRSDGRNNILKGAGFKLIAFGFVFALVALIFLVKSFFSSSSYVEHDEQNKVESTPIVKPIVSGAKGTLPQSTPKMKTITPQPKKKDDGLLNNSDSVYYVSELKTRQYGKVKTRHLFKVKFSDSYVFLDQYELTALDYRVKIVNECLAVITGFNQTKYALCESNEDEQGFIESTIVASN